MTAHLDIESILEKSQELHTLKASLGHQGTMLLNQREEMGEPFRICSNNSLAKQQSALGSTYVEHVTEAGDVGKCEIGDGRCKCITKTGSVEIEGNPVPAADFTQRLELGKSVHRAGLGGLGDVEHPGSNHVLIGLIPIKFCDKAVDISGVHLAIAGGDHNDLVSAVFHGTALVRIDMGRRGCHDTFVAAKESIDDRRVGLSSTDEKLHQSPGSIAGFPDGFTGLNRIVVVSIANRGLKIGFHQSAHHLRMCAFHIIAVEINHDANLQLMRTKTKSSTNIGIFAADMKSDIIVIGGGASGLMAAYSAGKTAIERGEAIQVTVLEKMPRAGRKIMITGKGRCNFTNVKDWNEFSAHIRSKAQFLKPSFYNMPSAKVVEFFESLGMKTVVERGDRAFPASYRSSDVVDALVNACYGVGVKIETENEVQDICKDDKGWTLVLADGRKWFCSKLIVATGGLSYPTTGSTGDGHRWACETGHKVTQLFPSLTALVPRDYKDTKEKGHIDRSTPLSESGKLLCGIQLKNIGLQLLIDGMLTDSEFGDIDFTDGGLEGPIGFQISRKAVKALVNGSKAAVSLDLKPGVSLTDLTVRVKELWSEISKDPRSTRLREKERCRILLGKLMPWDLIPAFTATNPGIITLERRSRTETKVWVNLVSIAKALKEWKFDLAGYVGYERAVVTAGGVSLDEVSAKTMESKTVPGLYFCGEVLDVDADTGGYNLQAAFCTGALAGHSAVLA